MVWELGSCLILGVSLCIFFIRTATVIKEKSGYDMMQEAANLFKILEHDIQFLWLHTLSTVKFGINVRLFRIVFYYLQWILHELHLIMYFQISRYCTRRNVWFFIRPNLRTGKVDQLPDHLQYSHSMNILHGSR